MIHVISSNKILNLLLLCETNHFSLFSLILKNSSTTVDNYFQTEYSAQGENSFLKPPERERKRTKRGSFERNGDIFVLFDTHKMFTKIGFQLWFWPSTYMSSICLRPQLPLSVILNPFKPNLWAKFGKFLWKLLSNF